MLNLGQSQRLAKELKHMSSELLNYHGHLLMIMIDFRYKFICLAKGKWNLTRKICVT